MECLIEVYKGKAIVHSLANFAIEAIRTVPGLSPKVTRASWGILLKQLFSIPLPEQKKTIIVKCIIRNKKIEGVSFLPCLINDNAELEILPRRDERSQDIFQYMVNISREVGLDTVYSWEGDEVLVAL